MSYILNIWYVAGWSKELGSDGPIGRVVAGEPIMLWRKSDGTAMAMADRCPHRHAPLSRGVIADDTVRCMYHGLRFSETGRCIGVPGTDQIPPSSTVRVYPIVEKDSWLWIWMGDPMHADGSLIPDAFGLDNPAWLMNDGVLDYEADYQLINDNLTDLSHLDFVHETTLGAIVGVCSADQPKIAVLENGVRIERWFADHMFGPGGERTDTFNRYHYLLPGLFLMTTRTYPIGTAQACAFGDPGDAPILFERVEQQAVTPIGPGRTRYLFATGVGSRFASPELLDGMMGVVNAAFEEDRLMIEAQQKIWDLTPPEHPKAFIPQDKAPSIFRRLIARRIAKERDSAVGISEPKERSDTGLCASA